MKTDAITVIKNLESPNPSSPRTLTEAVPANLPNGGTIYIGPEVLDSSGNVSLPELDFDWFRRSLDGLAEVVKGAFDRAKPTKTSVELNLQLGLKAGQLAAVLVDANTTASFKITLEWESGKESKA